MIMSGGYDFEHLVKPLLMPLLFLYFAESSGFSFKDDSRLVFLALFFCWLGDSFLMYSEISEAYFLIGLVSFLIGHVFYILVYRRFVSADLKSRPPTVLMILLLAYFSWILLTIYPGLGSMFVPVLFYSIVILTMAVVASLRKGATTNSSYWLVLIGALLFVISDSLIAYTKFSEPIKFFGPILIMGTYTLGQFLIIQGLINHWNNK